MSITEIVSGIYRIESILGPRPFAQYLLRDQRSLLVDTGIISTPDEVLLPAFQELRFDPADLDFVLITHADADHFGGNAAVREVAPQAILCAHAEDVPLIVDRERIMRERYGWYAAHGAAADYDEGSKVWLRDVMGADVPIDLHLVGGEWFRLGPALAVEVLHLPGHTSGHLGLWEPVSRTAIMTDAVLGEGLLNAEGKVIHPPPYMLTQAYETSIRRLQGLRPARLLTAHYPVMAGEAVVRFLDVSLAFVARARAAVRAELEAQGEVTLAGLLASLDPILGPFTSMANELGGPLRAHLRELVDAGQAKEYPEERPPVWRRTA